MDDYQEQLDALVMELETRVCAAPNCSNVFRVMMGSSATFCSSYCRELTAPSHDRHRRRKINLDMTKVKELYAAGYIGREAAKVLGVKLHYLSKRSLDVGIRWMVRPGKR